MEGLLSFLLFAGAFYLMMRFGCGAHMTHGSHGHHQHDDETAQKHIDPVCGMNVEAEQGYGKMHDGQLYRFCSHDCMDKFEAEPGKYTNKNVIKGGVS